MADVNQTSYGLPVVNFPVIAWRALAMVAMFSAMAYWFFRSAQRAFINPLARQLESMTFSLKSGGKVHTIEPGTGLPTGQPSLDAPFDAVAAFLPGQSAVYVFAAAGILCAWAAFMFLRRWLSGKPALTVSPAGITAYGTGMAHRTLPWELYDGTVTLKGNYQILSKVRTWFFMRDRVNVPLFLIGESPKKLDSLITTYATAMRGLSPSHPARHASVHQKAEPLGEVAAPAAPFSSRPVPAASQAAAPVSRSGIRFAGRSPAPLPGEPRKSPHEIRRRV